MQHYKWTGRQQTHRKVMEDFLGRKLKTEECVHHINGDISNNCIENLQVLSVSDHTKLHSKTGEIIMIKCDVCGKEYPMRKKFYLWRKKRQSFFACSKRCVGLRCVHTLPRKYSWKTKKSIVLKLRKDYASGLSTYKLADKYNLNRRTVTSYLRGKI